MPTKFAGINVETGLRYPKLQLYVCPQLPFLINIAAKKAGYRHSTLWIRDRFAQILAEELEGHEDAETYEEILKSMPPSWEERPGGWGKPGERGVSGG